MSTGSILAATPSGYSGHVLGSGLMDREHGGGPAAGGRSYRDNPLDLTRASVHLLRGKLTRSLCLTKTEPLLGDPGILAYLFAPAIEPKYELGIIPHYVERDNNEQVIQWRNRGAHVIDIQSGIQTVINEACKCKRIVSSALHGLILSDSLGIPNHIVILHDYRVWLRGFKFNDYYSAYNEEAIPVYNIDAAFDLCKTRDTTKVKTDVRRAFDNFVKDFL
jgi:hypothetical protein